MTIEQVRSQSDSEWVRIGDPKTDAGRNVPGDRVLPHGKDRDEVQRKAVALRPKRSAAVYTGEIPEEATFPSYEISKIGAGRPQNRIHDFRGPNRLSANLVMGRETYFGALVRPLPRSGGTSQASLGPD
jgi:hypothetical protein